MTAPPTEALKLCKGPLCTKVRAGGTMRPLAAYSKWKGDTLRHECRRCLSFRENARKKARKTRKCVACKRTRPLSAFDMTGRGRSNTCRPCVAFICSNVDPLTEAETDLRKGLRAKARWAVTLVALMSRWGIDLAGYKALRGTARVSFEAQWSTAMKEAARAEFAAGKTVSEIHGAALRERPRTLTRAANAWHRPDHDEDEDEPQELAA